MTKLKVGDHVKTKGSHSLFELKKGDLGVVTQIDVYEADIEVGVKMETSTRDRIIFARDELKFVGRPSKPMKAKNLHVNDQIPLSGGDDVEAIGFVDTLVANGKGSVLVAGTTEFEGDFSVLLDLNAEVQVVRW